MESKSVNKIVELLTLSPVTSNRAKIIGIKTMRFL